MTASTNFKRPGRTRCQHGHLHPNPDSAKACDVAWRIHFRKKYRVDELVAELRKIVFRERRPS